MMFCPECGKEFSEDLKICPDDGSILTSGTKKGDLFIGKTIGEKYRVIEKLGDGGMGSVYKAEHLLMSRNVALKVLRRSLADDSENDEFVRRFQGEARTASKISHPNAITIHDFGLEGDTPYLVMELNEGKSLKSILAETGALPLSRICTIMRQVCDAVDEAHAYGIVHRDLKPDNIMISQKRDGSDYAVVLDFGIAKILGGGGGDKDSAMTKTGAVIGTPKYMSPEQVIARELDGRSDIYSLGIILFEMLTGEVPFEADSAMQLMIRHVNEVPTPVRELKPSLGISQAIESVVAKALEKEQANRHQTVVEFIEELEAAANGTSASSSSDVFLSSEAVVHSNSSSSSKPRSWSAIAAVLSLLLLGGGGAGFYFLNRVPHGEPEIQLASAEDTTTPDMQQNGNKATRGVPEGLSEGSENGKGESIEDYLGAGTDYIRLGHYDKAAVVLEKAVQVDPENVAAYKKLAATYTKLGRDEQALKYYQEVVHRDPKDAKAQALLGFTYKNLGKFEEARHTFQTVLVLDPTFSMAEENLAEIDRKLNKKNAEKNYVRANYTTSIPDLIEELKNDDREVRVEAANSLEARGKDAVPELVYALKHQDARIRYWSADILGRLRAKEAVDPLIVALHDRVPIVVQSSSQALRKIGTPRAREAVSSMERAKLARQRRVPETKRHQKKPAKNGFDQFVERLWITRE